MDVLHFIKSYHDEVRTVLAAMAANDGIKVRRAKLDDCAGLVQTYLDLERAYLYPETQDLFPGAETLCRVGEANGVAISRRMKALQKLAGKAATEQDGYDKRLAELKEAVLAHFDAEEQLLMPKMRLLIRTEDREDLGQVFVDAREELRSGTPAEGVSPGVSTRKRA